MISKIIAMVILVATMINAEDNSFRDFLIEKARKNPESKVKYICIVHKETGALYGYKEIFGVNKIEITHVNKTLTHEKSLIINGKELTTLSNNKFQGNSNRIILTDTAENQMLGTEIVIKEIEIKTHSKSQWAYCNQVIDDVQ